MSQVFCTISHGHHLCLLLSEHKELAIADLANLTEDFFAALKLDAFRKSLLPSATVWAVLHSAEITLNRLLEDGLAGEAVRLILC